MRKLLVVVGIITAALLFSSTVFASSWTPPSNVRIVQKSNTDNVRIFGTIIAALNSITNASATNPYVVKVMPGIYSETVTMKPYVDVVGSGPENTIITASNNNIDGSTCTVGTVVMANNSAIRNIKVVNTAPALGGDYITVAALVFNNVKAKAEGIGVLTGLDDTVVGGQNDGICTYGNSADVMLNNVYVETHNNSGQSNAIKTMGGKLTLTNSKLSSFNNNGSCDVINDDSSAETPSTIKIISSTIEATGHGLHGIWGGSSKVSIFNSTISLNDVGGPVTGFQTSAEFTMVNSKIASDNSAVAYEGSDAIVKISHSLLSGDISSLNSAKLVNNYNENFNPIPNQ